MFQVLARVKIRKLFHLKTKKKQILWVFVIFSRARPILKIFGLETEHLFYAAEEKTLNIMEGTAIITFATEWSVHDIKWSSGVTRK